MIKRGYQRITPFDDPEAVMWWYVREYADGFVAAYSGKVRKTRLARKAIGDAANQADQDHLLYEGRPVALLTSDGELRPVDYGPYGAEHRA